jgi:hypothetical protein
MLLKKEKADESNKIKILSKYFQEIKIYSRKTKEINK